MAEREAHRGTRLLLCTAAVVIVVAGLKASGAMLMPVIMALFLSLLCVPPMKRLQSYGIPSWGAIVIVIVVATLIVLLITAVVGRSVVQFQDSLEEYKARLDVIMRDGLGWLQSHGIDVDADNLAKQLDTGKLMDLVGTLATQLLSVLGNIFMVVLTMIFMLAEASGFPTKLRRAIGDPRSDLGRFRLVGERINKYLAIKALVSLGTGVCVIILTAACGVDFPLLWGLLAFLLNFIPNIGSILAAIPACLLALLQHGFGTALIVAVGFLVINLIIGNAVEPKLMGRRLGLSTLVVFLSLIFWNWVWGPMGALLSVPLTVILKISLEDSGDFRWVAVLLGPDEDDLPTPAKAATSTAGPQS
jgi:predicted PurR-regulated permease PerM